MLGLIKEIVILTISFNMSVSDSRKTCEEEEIKLMSLVII